MPGQSPSDACPYPRPFPAGFDECPTFHPQLYVPLTSQFGALPAVRSCQFLVEGESAPGHFYARCRLGTQADRVRWLAEMDPERLKLLKEFRRSLSVAVAGEADRLWALKGRQLVARQQHDAAGVSRATEELNLASGHLEELVGRFLEVNQESMQRLGLPLAETKRLIHELLEDMVLRRDGGSGPVPVRAELLNRFPPEVRAIFQPYEASVREPTEA